MKGYSEKRTKNYNTTKMYIPPREIYRSMQSLPQLQCHSSQKEKGNPEIHKEYKRPLMPKTVLKKKNKSLFQNMLQKYNNPNIVVLHKNKIK